MYVCERCHPNFCTMDHVILTLAHCGVCRRSTECVDCSSTPVNKEEIQRQGAAKRYMIGIYRHTKEVNYPSPKGTGPVGESPGH
jgi:hypothetical protein